MNMIVIEDWNTNVKLQRMRDPEPSNHPDPRMHLTIREITEKNKRWKRFDVVPVVCEGETNPFEW